MRMDGIPRPKGVRLLGVGVVCATAMLAAGPAFADFLPPGSIAYKTHPSEPELPKYSTVLPDYISPANLVGSLSSPMTRDFTGTVMSWVYRNPTTGFLTFVYQLTNTDTKDFIVRATIDGWAGVEILDAGADASGSSGTGDPAAEWTDGDPRFLGRDPSTGGIEIQWRFPSGRNLVGTVIGPGDTSSRIWFATNQTEFTVGNMDYIDTAATGESQVLIPIPAPAAMPLALLGLAVAGQARRWSRGRNPQFA